MATRLYPPTIAGNLPAFNGTTSLTIPFVMNRSVSMDSIKGFALKVKSVRAETYIGTLYSRDNSFTIGSNSSVTFYFGDEQNLILKQTGNATEKVSLTTLLNEGQFYKVQLAYIDKTNTMGYLSTLGLIKYTSEPANVYIENMVRGEVNSIQKEFVGVYEFGNDTSEKAYSYRFIIRDNNGTTIADSGEQLHNCLNDEGRLSTDTFIYDINLDANEIITAQYFVTTINGLNLSSPKYRITGSLTVAPVIKTNLLATLNYENGYINITMDGTDSTTGNFMITRKDLTTNSKWEDIYSFAFLGQKPKDFSWGDFTIEQGHTYKYGIQQYNSNGIFSDRITTPEIFADFEDAFLYDGTRQLKIRYNPKVSSFKADILEAKTDTIGSKHPFIFRNGSVNYKEFPISGLISYLSDNDELFMSNAELALQTNSLIHRVETSAFTNMPKNSRTTDLVGYNISAERTFKLNVLDWLNNGEPKLFRSPGEGNYIVRLLNNSLTPTDSVGRMLHTFNSTAYEIADFTFDKLNSYGFISNSTEITSMSHSWSTIKLNRDLIVSEKSKTDLLASITGVITGFKIDDMLPDTPIQIVFESSEKPINVFIGTTGSYSVSGLGNISQVLIDNMFLDYGGMITVEYISTEVAETATSFGLITEVENYTCPVEQFIGRYDYNIIPGLSSQNRTVVKYVDLLFELLPVIDIYTRADIVLDSLGNLLNNGNAFYIDPYCTQSINITSPLYVYKVHKANANFLGHEHADAYNTDSSNYLGKKYEIPYVEGHTVALNALLSTLSSRDILVRGQIISSEFHKGELYYVNAQTSDYFDLQDGYLIVNNSTNKINFIQEKDYNPCFEFNGNSIDLSEIEYYELFNNIGKVDSITLGNGVMLTCAYIARTVKYSLEDLEPVRSQKAAYNLAYERYWECFKNPDLYGEIDNRRLELQRSYTIYQNSLKAALDEYKSSMGGNK